MGLNHLIYPYLAGQSRLFVCEYILSFYWFIMQVPYHVLEDPGPPCVWQHHPGLYPGLLRLPGLRGPPQGKVRHKSGNIYCYCHNVFGVGVFFSLQYLIFPSAFLKIQYNFLICT